MSVLSVHTLRTAFNKETNVKKKEKGTPPRESTAAKRRKSVPCTETKPENRELGSRTDSLLPNNPGLDRPPVENRCREVDGPPSGPDHELGR